MPNDTMTKVRMPEPMDFPFPEINPKPEFKDNQKFFYISSSTLRRIEQVCELSNVAKEERLTNKCNYKIPVNNSLNTTEENYLKNDAKGVFWINNRNQQIKLGKVLKQLWGSLDSTQIEMAVTKWKARYIVDTSNVIVGNDIGRVYDISSVGSSCMAGHGEWMKLYEDLGTKIAYILDDDGSLRARALLWDKNVYQDNNTDNVVTILDRVFFENENDKITLETWAREKGYMTSFATDTRTCKSVDSGYDGVPYIDSMYTLIRSEVGDGEWQLSAGYGDEYDTLQSTNGNSEHNCGISLINNEDCVYCEDIDEEAHIDEVYYNNTHDCYYAHTDDLVNINYEWYHIDDERLVYTEDNGYVWREDAFLAYDSDEWYSDTDSLTYCEDIEDYVTEDGATYVKDYDYYVYHTDDLYCDNNCNYWSSEDAYIEENGEDDE